MVVVTWEEQGGFEQISFDLDEDGCFAYLVKDGRVVCDERCSAVAQRGYDAMMAIKRRASDVVPFRVVVRSASKGTAVVLYGPVARAKSRSVDVEQDTELGVVLEVALELAAL